MRNPLRPFAYFTALTCAACLLLIIFIDQPLAQYIHQHAARGIPFFLVLTKWSDIAHESLLTTHVLGLPVLYVGPAVAYLVGRWALRKKEATLFLVLLLTHLCSIITANVLKGMVHRLRPEVLFSTGYQGAGFLATGPHNDSFPSAHTASYFSLFLPLAVAFPRYRVSLLVLPVLIGLGRLVMGAHYLSDIWFSVWIAVAYTVLFGLLRGRRWA